MHSPWQMPSAARQHTGFPHHATDCEGAWQAGADFKTKEGWHKISMRVMQYVLYHKFSASDELKDLLLGTGRDSSWKTPHVAFSGEEDTTRARVFMENRSWEKLSLWCAEDFVTIKWEFFAS
eukprot:6278911-Amphidinium_carterae.1